MGVAWGRGYVYTLIISRGRKEKFTTIISLLCGLYSVAISNLAKLIILDASSKGISDRTSRRLRLNLAKRIAKRNEVTSYPEKRLCISMNSVRKSADEESSTSSETSDINSPYSDASYPGLYSFH